MDMYNSSGSMYGQPVSGNHSDRMEIAAMTLGNHFNRKLYLPVSGNSLRCISHHSGFSVARRTNALRSQSAGRSHSRNHRNCAYGCHLYFGVCIYTARVRKYRRYSQSLLRHDRYRLQPAAATIKDDMSHHGISGHCKHQIFDEAVCKYKPKCDPQIDISVAHTDCDFSFGQPLYRLGNHKPAAKNGRIYNDRMVIKGF